VTSTTLRPHLWNNPGAFAFDLLSRNWNNIDGDSDGYRDDAYGWNFGTGSPDFIDNANGGHGAAGLGKVLGAINAAGSAGDHVKIMYVIDWGSIDPNTHKGALDYVLDQQA